MFEWRDGDFPPATYGGFVTIEPVMYERKSMIGMCYLFLPDWLQYVPRLSEAGYQTLVCRSKYGRLCHGSASGS